jgi:hypothetical protein
LGLGGTAAGSREELISVFRVFSGNIRAGVFESPAVFLTDAIIAILLKKP